MSQPLNDPCDLVVKLSLAGSDRWSVYYRFQELGIPCVCKMYQPLEIHCRHVLDIIQCWTVARRLTQPRRALAEQLEACLLIPAAKSPSL